MPRAFVVILALLYFGLSTGVFAESHKESKGLTGPVRSVRTEVSESDSAGNLGPAAPLEVESFSTDGWLTEVEQYGQGKLLVHMLLKRSGSVLLEQDSTVFTGPDPKRLVSTLDAAGRPTHQEAYSLSGDFLYRVEIEYHGSEKHISRYDGTGKVVNERVAIVQEKASGDSIRTYEKGKLAQTDQVEDTPAGVKTERVVYGPDGKVTKRTVTEKDATGERSATVTSAGNSYARIKGPADTDIVSRGPNGGRIHFERDKNDRILTEDHYDRQDQLESHIVYEYTDDDHGNWIRRSGKVLHNGQQVGTRLMTRTITYY
jgi:hypothetical protein